MNLENKKITSEALDCYLQAGTIARRIREMFKDRIEEGKSILELCEELECEILSCGASLAFPCNIGINHIAAHYTPTPSDQLKIGPTDLVKIDYGLHINGYIVDVAFSVALSRSDLRLVKVTELALEEVVKSIRVGDRISKVGEIIEHIAKKNLFKVIENLQGHEIDRYRLHSGISIPNVPSLNTRRFRDNMIIAIEPFLTYGFGAGRVRETSVVNIFQLPGNRGSIPSELIGAFDNLPFCQRWLDRYSLSVPPEIKKRMKYYPVLVEANEAPIAQTETTLILLKDETIDLVS